jgi:hypothetical protein
MQATCRRKKLPTILPAPGDFAGLDDPFFFLAMFVAE